MGSWKVTVRRGSDVDSERYDSLEEALGEAQRQAAKVTERGGLDATSGFREYAPGQQVEARIEVVGPGLFRRAEGGIDVMGDGQLVVYEGSIRKLRLDQAGGETAFDALRQALDG